jgi:hypothetical protein
MLGIVITADTLFLETSLACSSFPSGRRAVCHETSPPCRHSTDQPPRHCNLVSILAVLPNTPFPIAPKPHVEWKRDRRHLNNCIIKYIYNMNTSNCVHLPKTGKLHASRTEDETCTSMYYSNMGCTNDRQLSFCSANSPPRSAPTRNCNHNPHSFAIQRLVVEVSTNAQRLVQNKPSVHRQG